MMNAEQYARHRGVSKMTAVRWCSQGKVPAVKVGKEWQIDPAAADAMLPEMQDTRRPKRASAMPPPAPAPAPKPEPASKPAKPKPTPPPKAAKPAPPIHNPAANGPTLAEAQRAKAVYQAERERLALMREKEELVLASDVRDAYFTKARQLRDALLNLATRLAPILATVSDAAECHRLLSDEHAIALRSLADG